MYFVQIFFVKVRVSYSLHMRNKVFLSRLDVSSEYIDAGSLAAGSNRKRQGQDAATNRKNMHISSVSYTLVVLLMTAWWR